jgi:hypothetical protein
VKRIYLAFTPEDLRRKQVAEAKCHGKAKALGYKDWWDWFHSEEKEAYKFCLKFK